MDCIQDVQNFLTAAAELIVTTFFILMLFDFIAGLAALWNSHSSKTLVAYQRQTSPIPQPSSPLKRQTNSTVNTSAAIDSEALALLIEQSKQATIRAAARRLGIAVKVNGRYQRMAILRIQIKTKLQSNPLEVARVFAELKGQQAA